MILRTLAVVATTASLTAVVTAAAYPGQPVAPRAQLVTTAPVTTAPLTTAPAMRPACPVAPPGHARCFALFRPETAVNQAIAAGVRGAAAKPHGWTPQALESAYRLPVSRNSHQTVAISIAFDTPQLGRFLSMYRSHYKLPPCTAASGCFRKVNQHGKASPLPQSGVGSGWDLEATLDVSMVSAACPHCKILVVEANDNEFSNLAAGENTAARLGAQVISNSYGGRETGFLQTLAPDYHHPGHTIVVSSGDFGYTAANFPANLTSVTAVGGTQLKHARNARGWTEQVWYQPGIFGAGSSGCSAYVAKPAWQHDPHCPGRTVADVAAVATNVPIYEKSYGGWVSVAGTSISAPLIAGVYGLAGNASTIPLGNTYAHARSLFDVTSGSNALFGTPAATCGGDYLCVAKKGYDAPTGMGTPDGTGAF
jgi:subtilase family protein